MKAITLWQPWASLCVERRPDHVIPDGISNPRDWGRECDGPPVKTIETRSWPASKRLLGQRIAIHAAKTSKPWEDLDSPSLLADRQTIDEVLRAFGVMSDDGRSWPSPYVSERMIHLGDVKLPLGAIVGTAVLADCVPMVADGWPANEPWRPALVIEDDTLTLYRTDEPERDEQVDDQLPFGLFEPGRWGWLLTDAVKLDEPIHCTGRQGLWNVPPEIFEALS